MSEPELYYRSRGFHFCVKPERHKAAYLSWRCPTCWTALPLTGLHPNSQTNTPPHLFHALLSLPKMWLQVAQRRICPEIFSQREPQPCCYMLSQNIMPLLLGYQFCSCWERGRKSKVTQGVILMGPVMRVDRLRRGGGWALTRCCLQIGLLRVRHPRWVISPLQQPLSYRMICY